MPTQNLTSLNRLATEAKSTQSAVLAAVSQLSIEAEQVVDELPYYTDTQVTSIKAAIASSVLIEIGTTVQIDSLDVSLIGTSNLQQGDATPVKPTARIEIEGVSEPVFKTVGDELTVGSLSFRVATVRTARNGEPQNVRLDPLTA